MGRFQSGAAVVVVVSLLLFLACDVSGDPSSSSGSKVHHAPAHIRKLLGTSEVASPYCGDYVDVNQNDGGPAPGQPDLHLFSVTFTNTDLEQTVCGVHIYCADLIDVPTDPRDFKNVAPGDCIVRKGGALGPGDSIFFDYNAYAAIPFKVTCGSCC